MARLNINTDYWMISSRGAIVLTEQGDNVINDQLHKLHAVCLTCKSRLCCRTYAQGSVVTCPSNSNEHHRKLTLNISREFSQRPKVISLEARGPG